MLYNKRVPYNDLPKLPPGFDFDDVDILKLVNKANIALSSFNGTSKLLPNRSIIIEPLSVKEAVASSGVENINTTVSEVFRAELFPDSETTDAQKETLHYKDALIEGWGMTLQRGFLNTNDFIALQSKLEPAKPGLRRKEQTKEPVRIENSLTKEVIYTPPEGYDLICRLLKNYEEYYNNFADDGIDPLIKLALLHYQFEAIHPFRDGNGRTGRILMVLYLVLAQRIDLPMLFISGYILQNRDEYYNRLKRVTENGEWKEWVMYILNAVIQQSKNSEDTIMGIKNLIEDYKKLAASSRSLPKGHHVVDYLFSKPIYTYNDMAKRAHIHRNTADTYLNILHKAGMLKKDKFKREAIFYNPKFVALL